MNDSGSFEVEAVFSRPEPAGCYAAMARLKAILPDVAGPMFRRIAGIRAARAGRPPLILDLGCGYGTLALSLRFGLTLAELSAWYGRPRPRSSATAIAMDRRWLARKWRRLECRIAGLDASAAAVGYAAAAGAVDEALIADLDQAPLGDRQALVAHAADMVVCACPFGRVTERALTHLMLAFERWRAPWVAMFLPRTCDHVPIARNLARFALTTERLEPAAFVQRRFFDGDEYDRTLASLEQAGKDPAGREEDGLAYASLLVARPASEIDRMPLRELLGLDVPRPALARSQLRAVEGVAP